MADVFYPCCEVGDRVTQKEEGPLKTNCWHCGAPDFERVTNLDVGPYFSYYSFTYNARIIRPTDEPPPWSF